MKVLILSALLAMASALPSPQQGGDIYRGCDGAKTCLGSTAVDDDPLTNSNACLASQVSTFNGKLW